MNTHNRAFHKLNEIAADQTEVWVEAIGQKLPRVIYDAYQVTLRTGVIPHSIHGPWSPWRDIFLSAALFGQVLNEGTDERLEREERAQDYEETGGMK